MELPNEIVTKLVGLKYNPGPAPAGATVELVREYDFPNHIVAYNESDLKVGSVIHTRYDPDIIDGVPNNDEIIDIFHRYTWVVTRSNKSVAWIKGTLNVPKLLPMEEEETLMTKRIENMGVLIKEYNRHIIKGDEETCKHIARLIEQLQKMGEYSPYYFLR